MILPLHDKLIIGDNKISVNYSPVYPPELPWQSKLPLLKNHPALVLRCNDEVRSHHYLLFLQSGHQAIWEIKQDDRLYLVELHDYFYSLLGKNLF